MNPSNPQHPPSPSNPLNPLNLSNPPNPPSPSNPSSPPSPPHPSNPCLHPQNPCFKHNHIKVVNIKKQEFGARTISATHRKRGEKNYLKQWIVARRPQPNYQEK